MVARARAPAGHRQGHRGRSPAQVEVAQQAAAHDPFVGSGPERREIERVVVLRGKLRKRKLTGKALDQKAAERERPGHARWSEVVIYESPESPEWRPSDLYLGCRWVIITGHIAPVSTIV